uniref:Uncharacterized protein n=1 Tax=Venturia canescens TaxID=32260 RepID=A0A0U1ZI49_9HYME|nr:hypothetical protein [Venturia canescens]
MDSNEAFTRAALYQSCKRSKILNNIDIENVDIQTLRALVNQHNAVSVRELPILISKYMVKFGLSFVVERFPKMRGYMNPENIVVQIEDDELLYLQTHEGRAQMNIYTIVMKNIAVSVLGSSIASLREQLNSNSRVTEYPKIKVKSVAQPIPQQVVPKTYTNKFDDVSFSPMLTSPLQRAVQSSKAGSSERDTNIHKHSDQVVNGRIIRRNELQAIRRMHRDRLTSRLRPIDNLSDSAESVDNEDEVDDIEETEIERRSLLGRRSSISKFNDSTILLDDINDADEKYLEYTSPLSQSPRQDAANDWLNLDNVEHQRHYATIEKPKIRSMPKTSSDTLIFPSESKQTINESVIHKLADDGEVKTHELKTVDRQMDLEQQQKEDDEDDIISIIEPSDVNKTTNGPDEAGNTREEFTDKSAPIVSDVSIDAEKHKAASTSDTDDKRITISFSDDEDD